MRKNTNAKKYVEMDNPCTSCKMTQMEKSACCGCPERLAYEQIKRKEAQHEIERSEVNKPTTYVKRKYAKTNKNNIHK